MKFLAIAAALISVIPAISALVINTPTGLVTCQPILLTYGSGVPPYYLSVLPGGQVAGTPYRVWDPTNAESTTWIVDLPGGTSISLAVKDSTGAQAYSDQATVMSGSDNSCLNSASSSNAAPASAAATGSAATRAATSGAAAASGGAPTTAVAATAGAKPAVTQSASSNAANAASGGGATTPATGGSNHLTSGAYAVGGAVGLIGALLL